MLGGCFSQAASPVDVVSTGAWWICWIPTFGNVENVLVRRLMGFELQRW